MTTIAARETAEITRPVRTLVPLIKHELELGQAAGLEHYRKAGELLLEAKEQIARGEWLPWLQRNFTLSAATANRYMQWAGTPKTRRRGITTLSEFTHPERTTHQPAWHEPVRLAVNKVDVERLAQERSTREGEERLTRELGLQLIDIGYKALLQKLHPDKGGSDEAMTRLNRVRGLLKQAL